MTSQTLSFSGLPQRLIKQELLTAEDAQQAQQQARQERVSLVHQLVSSGKLSARVVANAVAEEFGDPILDLSAFQQSTWQHLVEESRIKRFLKTAKYDMNGRYQLSQAYFGQGKLPSALKALNVLLKIMLKKEAKPSAEWNYQDVALRFFKLGMEMEKSSDAEITRLASSAYGGATQVCFLLHEGFTAFQLQLKKEGADAIGRGTNKEPSEIEFNLALHRSFAAQREGEGGSGCLQPLLPLLTSAGNKGKGKGKKPKLDALLAKLACHTSLARGGEEKKQKEEAVAVAKTIVSRSAKMAMMYPGLESATLESLAEVAAAFRERLYQRNAEAVEASMLNFFGP